jgi:hypothetical protein
MQKQKPVVSKAPHVEGGNHYALGTTKSGVLA